MTSQASSHVAPNELNTNEVGGSTDAKLSHPCPLAISRSMGIREDPQQSKEYLGKRSSQAGKMFDSSLASTPKECRVNTSDMLGKAVLFAQLLSESSFHKKRHLEQRDLAPACKRARKMDFQVNGDPSLPPRGMRYQRRNSFVIPNCRRTAFSCFSGCQESIESLTKDLSLQENGNFTFAHKNE